MVLVEFGPQVAEIRVGGVCRQGPTFSNVVKVLIPPLVYA